jgi:hypothetical protein
MPRVVSSDHLGCAGIRKVRIPARREVGTADVQRADRDIGDVLLPMQAKLLRVLQSVRSSAWGACGRHRRRAGTHGQQTRFVFDTASAMRRKTVRPIAAAVTGRHTYRASDAPALSLYERIHAVENAAISWALRAAGRDKSKAAALLNVIDV